MLKLLHLADVHLGKPFQMLGAQGAAQRRALEETFVRAVDLAIAKQVQVVLIAGDLFDSPRPSPALVELAERELRRLDDRGIWVGLVAGNHDAAPDGLVGGSHRLRDAGPHVVLFGRTVESHAVPALNLTITGCSASPGTPASPLSGWPRQRSTQFAVGVTHGSAYRGGQVEGSAAMHPQEIRDLGLDYLALGDWHSASEVAPPPAPAWYAGSPELLAYDQEGAGHVLMIEIAAPGRAAVTPVRIGRRQYKRLEIDAGTTDEAGLRRARAGRGPAGGRGLSAGSGDSGMILRRFHARRFLGLPDEAFEFAAGVNVVIGPNEAGKSSLRAAIHAVLYGNPATTSTKFRDEFRSWGAEEPPVLILEFEVDGKRFVLTKDFATRKVTLQDELGRTWDQHKIVQERVAAQLGLVTEDLFEATAQVAQAELERIHINSIAKELGRIVGGGGEDVTTAIRRLDQHVRAMEKGTKALTKDPGVLRATDDKVTSLKEEQRRLSSSAAAADRIRGELTSIRETLTTATDTLTIKRALLDQNREIVILEERLAGRQREEGMLEEKVKKIEDTLTKIAQVDRELESSTAAGLPDEDATATARKLSDSAAALEMQTGQLRHQLEQSDDIPAAHRLWRGAGVGGGGPPLTGTILAIGARVPAGL